MTTTRELFELAGAKFPETPRPAPRSRDYSYRNTAYELGIDFALDVQTWYFLNRDILPLIEGYQKRMKELNSNY